MSQRMTLAERLRNPSYIINPTGGDALLDVPQTIATMREAADIIDEMMRTESSMASYISEAEILEVWREFEADKKR